jgi:hypothetical protein
LWRLQKRFLVLDTVAQGKHEWEKPLLCAMLQRCVCPIQLFWLRVMASYMWRWESVA